jgi:tetratricopeptide (TPR) repeat protein
MSKRLAQWVSGVVVVLGCTAASLGHGDLHEQIAALRARIEKEPRNAELYLRRAELHRLHGEWGAAAGDYDRAEQLAPSLAAVALGRGKMLLATGRFDAAKAALDTFLAADPGHVEALAMRAQVAMRRGHPLAAADDLAKAIRLSPKPEPDLFLDRSRALVAAGDEHLADAIACLDEGMAKLGRLPTLGLPAIELELRRRGYDAALARLDQLSAGAARKETWLERRGDVLSAAARPEEARKAYQAALEAILSLPPARRSTKATSELEARLKEKLKS